MTYWQGYRYIDFWLKTHAIPQRLKDQDEAVNRLYPDFSGTHCEIDDQDSHYKVRRSPLNRDYATVPYEIIPRRPLQRKTV